MVHVASVRGGRIARPLILPFLLLWSLVVSALPAQVVEFAVLLDDGDPASADRPFGATFDPDGRHVYVPLAGLLTPGGATPPAGNNDDVLKIDVRTGLVVAQGAVGFYPVEAAVARDGTGSARHVYVSNSTDGTISCLTPDLATTVATVALSPCFGGVFFSSFPYGLLLSPDSTRLYVTTAGGCDLIDVVDVDPASPTFHRLVGSFAVPGAGGRPSWRAHPQMVVPTTTYDASFSQSQAGFAVVDVSNPAAFAVHHVSGPTPFAYHSANEAVAVSGDRVLVPVFGGATPTVHEASVATGLVLRTLTIPPALTNATLHGVAVAPDESIFAVTSFTGGDVVWIDFATFTLLSVTDHGATSLPNEVAFSPDGSRAVVTIQGSNRVDVMKGLPLYDLALDVPASLNQGASFSVGVRRCEADQPTAVFVSASPGPTQVGALVVALGWPFLELFSDVGAVDGSAGASFYIPVDPALSGLAAYVQAVTVDRDGGIRLSNGATTAIL